MMGPGARTWGSKNADERPGGMDDRAARAQMRARGHGQRGSESADNGPEGMDDGGSESTVNRGSAWRRGWRGCGRWGREHLPTYTLIPLTIVT